MINDQQSRAVSSLRRRIAVLVCLGSVLAAAGCEKKQAAPAPSPAVPVRVASTVQKTVPVQLRAIGNVEAYSSVAVKPQVSGEVTAVHFREGQDVGKGELLFSIDPRPFQVALQQAEANLARDKARALNARLQAERYAKLYAEGVASSQQNDLARSEADALDAAVRADEAAVEKAKLDLQYCSIHTPMDGRTGSLVVYRGNLVKANENPALVWINQLNPIYVNFSLPEQYLAEVKKYMAAGTLKVEAVAPDTSAGSERARAGAAESSRTPAARPELGTLTFIDNTVDRSTGTIRLKATFPNRQRRLWPGQFVDVVLTLTTQPNAIVVPAPAVQTGQTGLYVFVVKTDGTAESRPVVAGRTVENETIVEKGLQPGEIVITDGQIRLVPGAKVKIQEGPQASQQATQDGRS